MYFQVDVEVPPNAPSDMCSEVCPEIQETIMKGIRIASKNLHYNNSIPKLSFVCYEHSSTNKQPPHATVVNSSRKLMKCTVDAEVCSRMTDNHQIWFRPACGKCVVVLYYYVSGAVHFRYTKFYLWSQDCGCQFFLSSVCIVSLSPSHAQSSRIRTLPYRKFSEWNLNTRVTTDTYVSAYLQIVVEWF